MRKLAIVVVIGVLGIGAWRLRGDAARTSPDEKLAHHFEDICTIARDNAHEPVRGVRAFGRYLLANSESMHGAWGAMIAEIERIPDDEAHDERADQARETLQHPFVACADEFDEFFGAIEDSPEASAILENGFARLSRTFEIILSEVPATWLARLPPYAARFVKH